MRRISRVIGAVRTLSENPLYINAYVKIVHGIVKPTNWGDDINYHFLRHITKRNIAIYFETPIAVRLRLSNYLCIGSTLNYLTTPSSVVWGAGVIDESLNLPARPAEVCAVRGPLTRRYLKCLGIDCPEVYGDPALLLPFFYRPESIQRSTRGKICLVPHYEDSKSPTVEAIKLRHPEVDIIQIGEYEKWTDVVDRICQYDVVLSSSLHGLVIAEAYGIPNHWVTMSDKVIGGGFKFRDFYESLGKSISCAIPLTASSSLTHFASRPWTPGRLNLYKLLNACPFNIEVPIRYDHPLDL